MIRPAVAKQSSPGNRLDTMNRSLGARIDPHGPSLSQMVFGEECQGYCQGRGDRVGFIDADGTFAPLSFAERTVSGLASCFRCHDEERLGSP